MPHFIQRLIHCSKKLLTIASLLLGAFPSLCEALAESSFVVLKENGNSLLSYSQWKQAQQLISNEDDIVLTNDGKVLFGQLDKLPTLYFSFGPVELDLSDVAIAIFFKEGNQLKGQYIMPSGANYVGTLKQEDIIFHDALAQADQKQKIDIQGLNAIVVKNRADISAFENKNFFSLEFKNKDRLPIAPATEVIKLEKASLPVASIIEVTYNGGLQGILKDGKSGTKKLDFSLVKEKYFTVQLLHSGETLKLPWDKIALIQGCNCGFQQELVEVKGQRLAFASDGFDVFLQPASSEKQAAPQNEDKPVDKKTALDTFFLVSDFNSPFHISYDFEYLENAIRVEPYFKHVDAHEAIASGDYIGSKVYHSENVTGSSEEENREIAFTEVKHSLIKVDAEHDQYAWVSHLLDNVFSKREAALFMHTFVKKEASSTIAISPAQLQKINDDLLFEHIKPVQVDPPTFEVKDN